MQRDLSYLRVLRLYRSDWRNTVMTFGHNTESLTAGSTAMCETMLARISHNTASARPPDMS